MKRLSLFAALTRFFVTALVLLALCVMANRALADELIIPDGKWVGAYIYMQGNERKPVDFTVELSVQNYSFKGKIIEKNTIGENPSGWLMAEMIGRFNNDLSFSFMKKYDGSHGVTHAVFYKGKLDPDNFMVRGQWEINGATGDFYMKPAVY